MATLGRWNRTITDAAGNVANATVYVYKESDGLLATIYSDRAGATPKSNPFTLSNSDYGLAFFHATGGAYKVVAVSGSYSQTWRYEPVGTGAEFDSDSLSGVTPPTTTVPAGIHIAEATNNGSSYINLTVPAALAASYTFTLPAADVTMSGYAATLLDDADAATARATLGVPLGTSGATVPLLNGANTCSAAQTLSAALNLTSGQIDFPASQSASAGANTLDDYEEGTWTPDLQFGAAKVGITYTNRNGTYTKIGRLVALNFNFLLSAKGSSTGNAQTYGLPFTVAAEFYAGMYYCAGFSSVTGVPYGDLQSTYCEFRQMTTAAAASTLTNSNFGSTTNPYLSGYYNV